MATFIVFLVALAAWVFVTSVGGGGERAWAVGLGAFVAIMIVGTIVVSSLGFGPTGNGDHHLAPVPPLEHVGSP